MPKKSLRIFETSERTIEANVLSDIVHNIQTKTKRQVTIISPTQNQELELGFDSTFHGLPKGFTSFLQFKRPHEYSSKLSLKFARFVIDTAQLQTLLKNFHPNEAFYVFVPLPKVEEVVKNRHNLLVKGATIDIYDIPKRNKSGQKIRTVRVTKSALSPGIQVADPRKFEEAPGAQTVQAFCDQLGNGDIGIKSIGDADDQPNNREVRRLKGVNFNGVYYVHVSKDIIF